MHLSFRGLTLVHTDYVPSETAVDRFRYSAYRSIVCRFFKSPRETPGVDIAHQSAAHRRRLVHAVAPRHILEHGRAGQYGRTQRVDALFRTRHRRQHYMADAHIVGIMRIGLRHKAVCHRRIAQVRPGELVAVLHVLGTESSRSVEARSLGLGHFELVVHEHVEIALNCQRLELLAVVLVVEVLEFAQRHVLAGDIHKHGVFGGSEAAESAEQTQATHEMLFHCVL